MAWWMAIPAVMQATGTLMSAASEAKAGKMQALMMRQQADADRAAGTINAQEALRQGRLQESRALAVAAASGGGAADPTVIKRMADLRGEGEFNALSALYEGESAARFGEAKAKYTRDMAKQKAIAGTIAGLGSLGSSLYAKYGGAGSPTFNNTPAVTSNTGGVWKTY